MAITKIISDNEAAIKAAIRSNGEGAITGAILQEKMLLLNRDLFGGQIEYDTHILLADVEDAVANMRLRTDSYLFNFFKEWYNDDTWQNNYIALYGGRNDAYIVGYMRMYVVGSDFIECYIMGSGSNLLSFVIHPESADMEDNYISPEEAQYRSLPTILAMNLPWEEQTYADLSEMFNALGITYDQLERLLGGQYIYIHQTNGDGTIFYPVLRINRGGENGLRRVIVGESISSYETTAWDLDFGYYTIKYFEI